MGLAYPGKMSGTKTADSGSAEEGGTSQETSQRPSFDQASHDSASQDHPPGLTHYQTCPALVEGKLYTHPACPHNYFNPISAPALPNPGQNFPGIELQET
jgi:hypothetical protein